MVDDPLIQHTAVALGKRILQHRHDVAIGNASPDPAFTSQVETEGSALRQQLDAKYPQGMVLLTSYAKMQQPLQLAAGAPEAGYLAANAYVVANAAVYVNAAVATQVAVAAAAVAVAAVVVT
jgi:hypothetical protein